MEKNQLVDAILGSKESEYFHSLLVWFQILIASKVRFLSVNSLRRVFIWLLYRIDRYRALLRAFGRVAFFCGIVWWLSNPTIEHREPAVALSGLEMG